jgi:hypothetical protein
VGLDIDLAVESILNLEKYPLVTKALQPTSRARRPAKRGRHNVQLAAERRSVGQHKKLENGPWR